MKGSILVQCKMRARFVIVGAIFCQQMAQETFAEHHDMVEAPRYLIRDRDTSYGAAVTRRLRAMGIRDRPTAPRSPWQNGHVERLIGSIRRECLDHVVVFGERHPRHLGRGAPEGAIHPGPVRG